MSKTAIVIPTRLHSTRLRNKLLLDVCGKPLIWYTIQHALQASRCDFIIVASEDDEILDVVDGFNFDVMSVKTRPASSGSDRIMSMSELLKGFGVSYVVNLQGDEPMLTSDDINKVIDKSHCADVVTLSHDATYEEYIDPNCVKVVVGADGLAMYFSRSPIPYGCHDRSMKHIGIYGYAVDFLEKFNNIESRYGSEKLEQLSWLEHGKTIAVFKTDNRSIGVDTIEDFRDFENVIRQRIC